MFTLFILGILLLGLGWTAYYRRNWHRQLSANLHFEEEYVYAGEQAHLIETIENHKTLPVPVLEVRFHTRRELDFQTENNAAVSDYIYKRDIFAVSGRQRIIRRLTVDCRKRGFYSIGKMDLTTYSTMFKKRYSKEDLACNAKLYVYPKMVKVSDIVVTCERMLGTMQCAKHLYEDPFAFRSIREYTLTDPMKTINWKASAKSGNLMVNTFDSAIAEKVMIYLDVEDTGILRQEELVEESIAVAASLARKLLSGGMEVGIAVNAIGIGGTVEKSYFRLEPQSGKFQLHQIEQGLASYRANDRMISRNNNSIFRTQESKNASGMTVQDCTDTISYEMILSDPPEDTVLIFISKNAAYKQHFIEEMCSASDAGISGENRMGIWVLPVYSNEACTVKTTGKLQLFVREVDRK